MESGDVNPKRAMLGKEADAVERRALAEENRAKADVVDSCLQGIGMKGRENGGVQYYLMGGGLCMR